MACRRGERRYQQHRWREDRMGNRGGSCARLARRHAGSDSTVAYAGRSRAECRL